MSHMFFFFLHALCWDFAFLQGFWEAIPSLAKGSTVVSPESSQDHETLLLRSKNRKDPTIFSMILEA